MDLALGMKLRYFHVKLLLSVVTFNYLPLYIISIIEHYPERVCKK